MDLGRAIDTLAGWIARSRRIVAFTGAGISTECGIPDFRSPGGVWEHYTPVYFDEFLSSHEARRRHWEYKRATWPEMARARPGAAHLALARLEAAGRLLALITQNIDGLHTLAGHGPAKLLELHGTNREVVCLGCGRRWPAQGVYDRFAAEPDLEAPDCEDCGAPLKPATISFGQPLDPSVLQAAAAASADSDLFVVVGSSLVVYPAAGLPALAVNQGARLAIINLQPTPLDPLASLVLAAAAGAVLPPAVDRGLGGG